MIWIRNHSRRFGWAWVGLCVALSIHITDEALTDFLALYNPTVDAIRERIPFVLLPTFTFRNWLIILITLTTVLFALSPAAFRNVRWMVPPAYGFGSFMFANSLQHIAGSLYLGRSMPGVYSTPLLMVASIFLLKAARDRKHVKMQLPSN